MGYVEGFVAAVPTAGKDAYLAHAKGAAALFKEFGATRSVEAWGDDVPDGKVTDFARAVERQEGETVVFSWLEFPDKATRDSAMERIMSDPRMEQLGQMPFDGKRMIYGGFEPIVDERADGSPGYADGYVLPVPHGKKEEYRAMAAKMVPLFREFGATRVVEAWGDDVPEGKRTDFRRAVKATGDENVVFSFVEWPDKATRDAGWARIMEDERAKPDGEMPFDGKRMFWGGFEPILDA